MTMQPTDNELAEARELHVQGLIAAGYGRDAAEKVADSNDIDNRGARIAIVAALRTARQATLDRPARVAGRDYKAGELVQQVVGRANAHYDSHHKGALMHPHTGEPRDYRDVNSDPEGFLCTPSGPLRAATPASASEAVMHAECCAEAGGDPAICDCTNPRHVPYRPAPASGEPTSDDELPGMWERADFMGGATDCDATGEGQQGDARALRVGKHLIEMAVKLGYEDGGPEGVYEYMTRIHYAQGRDDALEGRATQQQAGQAVAWMTPEAIKHLDKQNGVAKIDAWNCSDGNNRVPVFTTPQTPDGYVLVPRDPTKEMLHAAFAIQLHEPDWLVKRYRAMIAASEASGG